MMLRGSNDNEPKPRAKSWLYLQNFVFLYHVVLRHIDGHSKSPEQPSTSDARARLPLRHRRSEFDCYRREATFSRTQGFGVSKSRSGVRSFSNFAFVSTSSPSEDVKLAYSYSRRMTSATEPSPRGPRAETDAEFRFRLPTGLGHKSHIRLMQGPSRKKSRYGQSCDRCWRAHLACEDGVKEYQCVNTRSRPAQPSATDVFALNQVLQQSTQQHNYNTIPFVDKQSTPPMQSPTPCSQTGDNALHDHPYMDNTDDSWNQRMNEYCIAAGRFDPEDAHDVPLFDIAFKKKKTQVMKFITEAQKIEMIQDYYNSIEEIKRKFHDVEIPCILGNHNGLVCWMNDAFRQLTGYSDDMVGGLLVWPDLLRFTGNHFRLLQHYMWNSHCTAPMLPIEMRIWRNNLDLVVTERINSMTGDKELYSEGTMSFTTKKDLLQLPTIFYGIFMPSSLKISQI
ncbi:hypothetical protein PROFUN_12958 [Planoprotostelium fungivorum]|uniref:PAS domain-containing protein n=1 Tax=Planoprotostelium fungivorum TaxID=1890364 RepID=A0A2P6N5Z0_9EUKA|nr:hypothetical protein PROFUN_12958 [Planoprotostelium fungivorum]